MRRRRLSVLLRLATLSAIGSFLCKTTRTAWHLSLSQSSTEPDGSGELWVPVGQRANETHSFHIAANDDDAVDRAGQSKDEDIEAHTGTKSILFYTTLWKEQDFRFGIGGPQLFEKAKCAATSCHAESFRSIEAQAQAENWTEAKLHDRLGSFDAVVFSIIERKFRLDDKAIEEINRWRQPRQRFVLFGYENAGWETDAQARFGVGFFNWTMTYLWQSDVAMPYGWFSKISEDGSQSDEKLSPALLAPWQPYDDERVTAYFKKQVMLNGSTAESAKWLSLARRPKLAAWMVSNFRSVSSMRTEYAAELGKHMPVDRFGGANKVADNRNDWAGRCGVGISGANEKKMRGRTSAVDCETVIARDYKFYLSFENALCNGYATEKIYARMGHAVPIALTQANLSRLLPPHSAISVSDYDSPKTLAEYVLYLDGDDVAYLSYFWWQRHYRVHSLFRTDAGFCLLCEKLRKDNGTWKVYDDAMGWWRGRSECGRTLSYIQRLLNTSL